MPRGVFLAFANAMPRESDDEFNQWYDQEHGPQVLAVPGVRSFRRFRLAADQVLPPEEGTRRYLALYEVDTDDWAGFANEFQQRFGDGRITIRPDLMELDPMVQTLIFEEITPTTSS
jgi:hypothetical protein